MELEKQANPICPNCNTPMNWCGDCGAYSSDSFTCPNCFDWAYDENGDRLWQWI